MSIQDFNFQDPIDIQSAGRDVAAKSFVSRVFSWMFAGLMITAVVAYLFASVPSLNASMYVQDPSTGLPAGFTGLGWFAVFAPLGLVLLMGYGMNKLSAMAMAGAFILYSFLMGMSMSVVFLVYLPSSIYKVFFITAAMFGTMAVLGYTTKTDLTKMGSFLYMALFGVIIASLINFFTHSAQLDYILSFVCVAIFTGLTAYKMQKIRQMGEQIGLNADDTVGKMAIFGALSLYLSFVNLFMALLRIMGNRR